MGCCNYIIVAVMATLFGGMGVFAIGMLQLLGIRLVLLNTMDRNDCLYMGSKSWLWSLLPICVVLAVTMVVTWAITLACCRKKTETVETAHEGWSLLDGENNAKKSGGTTA